MIDFGPKMSTEKQCLPRNLNPNETIETNVSLNRFKFYFKVYPLLT